MPVLRCTFGLDRGDAALNRPALVLRPEEMAELDAPWLRAAAPGLATILEAGDVAIGAGQLPALRAELRGALAAVQAPDLPERLVVALALQRLDSACAIAQEFGFNLYVSVVDG